ncbi:MAG: metallophosphoesterase [Muribaculum sp.]|nr:metallophosphoesterase [Muribaculum sp.]
MKIIHISDTHGCHRRLRDLPDADLIVHSGDFTMAGTDLEAIDFMNWFCDLPYAHKIFICGNHDDCLYGANIDGLDQNVHYLCNYSVGIDGVKFYGVPMFMDDCVTGRQQYNIVKVPADTGVLITHSPAHGILDFDDNINYGNELLLTKVLEINPKLHLFGHIHDQHGIVNVHGITFSNGAIMDSNYSKLSQPNLLTI